jgi:hypothetical protein
MELWALAETLATVIGPLEQKHEPHDYMMIDINLERFTKAINMLASDNKILIEVRTFETRTDVDEPLSDIYDRFRIPAGSFKFFASIKTA